MLTRCEPFLVEEADNSGETPLQMARYFGYVDLIDLFDNHLVSLNEGNKTKILPASFPLKDNFIYETEEVDNMAEEDFILCGPERTLRNLLDSPVLGPLPECSEVTELTAVMNRVMTIVAEKVSKCCPLFKFEPELSGSASEGTKCGFPDEFDYICTMVELSKCFQEPDVATWPLVLQCFVNFKSNISFITRIMMS